jgi:hypothetical protein
MRRIVFSLAMLTVALAPAVLAADDQQIAQTVVERLARQKDAGALRDFNLDLQVDNGQVWMKGRVASSQQQQFVLDIARRVPGVTQVVNDLKVEATASSAGEGGNHLGLPPEAASDIALATANGADPQMDPAQQSHLLGNLGMHSARRQQMAEASAEFEQPAESESRPRGLLASLLGRRDDVRQVAAEQPLSARRGNMPQAMMAGPPQSVGTGLPHPAAMPPMQRPGAAQGGRGSMPLAFAPAQVADARAASMQEGAGPGAFGGPQPSYVPTPGNITPATYDHPSMPNYAWPSYASYPNYAALTYPRQYSPTAWPYIGPFYPYPQVPLGWRKVTLEWDDGWWFLNFNDGSRRRRFRQ